MYGSHMSISTDIGQLKWNPGHEKIPDNWYKRHPTDEYSILYCKSLEMPQAVTRWALVVTCQALVVTCWNLGHLLGQKVSLARRC